MEKYNCVVLKVKKESFSAKVLGLDEEINCSMSDVDPEEVHLVKRGAKFLWFVTRYHHRVFCFNPLLPYSTDD